MNDSNSSAMFAHIVSRLADRTEDVAVEALGYILSRSEAARRALRDMLKLEGLDVGALTDVATQVSDETRTRPDLVVYDGDRKERVLVEAKFWAGLTENQPNAYLDRLPLDERPAVLLFVAPEARLETFWPELRLRIEHLFNWQPVDTPYAKEVKCALVDNGTRYLMLTSWRGLLDRMQSFAMASGDAVEHDIQQLYVLCDQQDQKNFLPLKPHELAPEIPRRMLQFNKLVDDVVKFTLERNIVNTDRLNVTSRPHGYGRYLRLGSEETNAWAGAWLGINYNLWAKHRETPLWLTIDSNNWDGALAVGDLRGKLGSDILASTKNSIPLRLPTGVEYQNVLDDVVAQLDDIAKKIAAAGATTERSS